MAGIDFWCLYDTRRMTVSVKALSVLLAGLGTPDSVWEMMCSLQEADRATLRSNARALTHEEERFLCGESRVYEELWAAVLWAFLKAEKAKREKPFSLGIKGPQPPEYWRSAVRAGISLTRVWSAEDLQLAMA